MKAARELKYAGNSNYNNDQEQDEESKTPTLTFKHAESYGAAGNDTFNSSKGLGQGNFTQQSASSYYQGSGFV